MEKLIKITNSTVPFFNNSDYCVGTGHIGLALRREYYEQLKLVQEHARFKYIRGHGLFSDDMAIYQLRRNADGTTSVEYNFMYLDMVMDMYHELGIKPFLELGFMPDRLASGQQTIFYWRGNTTPPKDYEGWAALVAATLSHLIERYGEDEAVSYPIEVWNEPNLGGFWYRADLPEYCKLYDVTARAIKGVCPRFRVGGPAICGVDETRWMTEFLTYCDKNDVPLDFITRHHYTIHRPDHKGRYDYCPLQEPAASMESMHGSREVVDSFERYRGMEIHITEFNTSYTPTSPIHDTNKNAAYIAYQLSRLGEDNYSYSYWTFGDVFEENGVPHSEFHGGFGLVAYGGIPKPTLWTFSFFRALGNENPCVWRDDNAVVVKTGDGGYRGVLWCIRDDDDVMRENALDITISLPADGDGDEFCVLTDTVDEQTCNPLKAWHDMGEPAYLSQEQIKTLRAFSYPAKASRRIVKEDGKINLSFKVNPNGVIYFEAYAAPMTSDFGYDYERVISE